MTRRSVKRVVTGNPAIDGAGVHLVRVLSNMTTEDFDPFLMLDAFDSKNPKDYEKGFPWHPHRGIETVTYLMEGEMTHGDSMGNKGTIKGGDCQWMTAGNGIIHEEYPQPVEQMLGAQLWINLPKKDKMVEPAYHAITANDIPVIEEEGAVVRVITGNYNNVKASIAGAYVDATYLDVTLNPDVTWQYPSPSDHTLFVYIFKGSGYFEDNEKGYMTDKRAVLFNPGDYLEVTAGSDGLRFILLLGKPLKEPIAWGGPIVMNTKEELNKAFQELEDNTFITHNKNK